MKQTLYCTVEYHYENIPSFLYKTMREWFIKNSKLWITLREIES